MEGVAKGWAYGQTARSGRLKRPAAKPHQEARGFSHVRFTTHSNPLHSGQESRIIVVSFEGVCPFKVEPDKETVGTETLNPCQVGTETKNPFPLQNKL